MFQTYEEMTQPENGPKRLRLLRNQFEEAGVTGFLVPRSDAHRGENVAPRDERLAWLTGFTGSAGFCAVSSKSAALFVDGRYTLQAASQVDASSFVIRNIPKDELSDWIKTEFSTGDKLGFDPWLHTKGELDKLEKSLEDEGPELVPVANPIDRIWDDQPAPPDAKIIPHPIEFAGKSHHKKIEEICGILKENDVQNVVLTLPDSIAWLLNIRGSDIERTPIPLAFAVLATDGQVTLFTNPTKIEEDVKKHFGDRVDISAPDTFEPFLNRVTGRIAVDKSSAPMAVITALHNAEIVWFRDPCILPKAQKNSVELAGARSAHQRDAVAMNEFLAWLDEEAPKGSLTEIDIAQKLENFRHKSNALRDISFDTISGSGPNGAIVHYRVNTKTNRLISKGDIVLVDSGGQYLDGTTDITRTVSTGAPPKDSKAAFTAVLKGMIAISRLRFPKGITGRDIDAFAHWALWQKGWDYAHGTGHGVGSYLGVHEGPASISRRGHEPLLAGMILSNEPGYYRNGAFGIRIENLICVTPAEPISGGEISMHQFETLTYVPIDQRLIVKEDLNSEEKDWLNAYHAECRRRMDGSLSTRAQKWLDVATLPL